jgi:hypothetical protein
VVEEDGSVVSGCANALFINLIVGTYAQFFRLLASARRHRSPLVCYGTNSDVEE